MATSCHETWQDVATINREIANREPGIDAAFAAFKSDTEIWNEVLDELRLQLVRATYDTWVRRSTAQRVDGRWEITCVNALAQDWMEHRLGKMIRRELEGVVGEVVGEIQFRVR